jgi:hypothetical protein
MDPTLSKALVDTWSEGGSPRPRNRNGRSRARTPIRLRAATTLRRIADRVEPAGSAAPCPAA